MEFTQYIRSKLVKVFLLKVNLISAFDSSDWLVVLFSVVSTSFYCIYSISHALNLLLV